MEKSCLLCVFLMLCTSERWFMEFLYSKHAKLPNLLFFWENEWISAPNQTLSSLNWERRPNKDVLTEMACPVPWACVEMCGDGYGTCLLFPYCTCSVPLCHSCLAFFLASSSFIRLTLELKARFCSVQRYHDVCIVTKKIPDGKADHALPNASD